MKDILSKLVVLESAIRSIRDELSRLQNHPDKTYVQDIRIGELADVTPAAWKQTFNSMFYSKPTEFPPYKAVRPGFVVGYPSASSPAIRVEQQPRIVENSILLYSLDCWLISPVQWITFNFSIPVDLFTQYEFVYFYWSSTVSPSQKVDITLYTKDVSGQEYNKLLETEYMPATPWSSIAKIKAPSPDTVLMSIVLAFDAKAFHSISIHDLRLLVDPKAE